MSIFVGFSSLLFIFWISQDSATIKICILLLPSLVITVVASPTNVWGYPKKITVTPSAEISLPHYTEMSDVMIQTMSKAVVDEVSTEVGKRLTDEERVKELAKLCFLRTKLMAHHNSRLEKVQAS